MVIACIAGLYAPPEGWGAEVITTVAGGGGSGGDGGPATSAQLVGAKSVAVTAGGGLLISEEGGKIRKVSPSGVISTFATGVATTSVAAAPNGGAIVNDWAYSGTVKRLSSSGQVTATIPAPDANAVAALEDGAFWVAQGYCGVGDASAKSVVRLIGPDDAIARAHAFNAGCAIDVSPLNGGGVLVADFNNCRIVKIDAEGTQTTVAGTGVCGYNHDSGAPTATQLNPPRGVDALPGGGFAIADDGNRLWKVSATGHTITRLAGRSDLPPNDFGDGCPAVHGWLASPGQGDIAADGSILLADSSTSGASRIRRVGPGLVSAPPEPSLGKDPSIALTGQRVSLNASGTTDPCRAGLSFKWDLDGDGNFDDLVNTDGNASTTFATPGVPTVSVRVSGVGGTATKGVPVPVRLTPPAGPLGISINGGARFTSDREVTLDVVWPQRAESLLISNDGGFRPSKSLPVAYTVRWRLDSSGPERLPKTVYARFQGGNAGPETYQDDIILDETAPKILSARLSSRRRAVSTSRKRRIRLRIKARDKTSGVARMQITQNRRKPGGSIKYRSRRVFRGVAGRKIYVRVIDRAGNRSKWRAAR